MRFQNKKILDFENWLTSYTDRQIIQYEKKLQNIYLIN